MKLIFFISILSTLLAATEASGILKYFLCGGHSNKPKSENYQDTPNDYDTGTSNYSPEEMKEGFDFEAKPFNAKKVKKSKNNKKSKVVPISDFDDIDVSLSEAPIPATKINVAPRTKIGENVKEIRNILGNNVFYFNCLNLNEDSARELLKIKIPMEVVLSPERRTNFMIRELDYGKSAIYIKTAISKILNEYDNEISEDLKKVLNLKDFLRIVIKFYKSCSNDLILKDCTLAVLGSAVFGIEELPSLFDMTFDEIFQISCENGLNGLAMEILCSKTPEELDLVKGVLSAFDDKNKKLAYELISTIRELYGNDEFSIFDEIISEIEEFDKEGS